MAQVKFKYGLFKDLNARTQDKSDWKVPISEGSIYVTTDTHSMFMDLKDSTGTLKRFRIGDFETYENLQELAKDSNNWYEGSLALIENANNDNDANQVPILAYYNGSAWININDTTALQTTLQGNIDKVAGDLTTLSGTVKNNSEAINENAEAIKTINTTIGDKNNPVDGSIWKAIADLRGGTNGDSLSSLRASIESINTTIGTKPDNITQTTLWGAIKGEIDRASGAEDSLDNRITQTNTNLTNNYATKSELNNAITKEVTDRNAAIKDAKDAAAADATSKANTAKANANAYTDGKIASVNTSIDNISTKVTTLIGADNNKSVRTIANEELAAQLIPDKATASLETLQEIAAWIQSHPGDAAAMNLYISNLEKIAADFIYEKDTQGNFIQDEQGNFTRLETVTQNAIKNYIDSIKSNLDKAIATTDAKLNWGQF